MVIEGSFQVTAWNEQVIQESPIKTSTVSAAYAVSGGMQGQAAILYAMGYLSDSEASFQGAHVFTVTINGKSGSFMIRETGRFAAPTASGQWDIEPGSGTDELQGITGSGHYQASHNGSMSYSLDINLPE